MSDLIKSRWRLSKRLTSVRVLLDALDIRYRKVSGQDFWEANREHLPNIYRELQSEARDKMRELHPDGGGDAEEFKEFVQAYRRVQKQMTRNGVIAAAPEDKSSAGLLVAKKGKGGFKNPTRALSIMRAVQQGITIKEMVQQGICSDWAARKIRHLMPCACGLPSGHKGVCSEKQRPIEEALSRGLTVQEIVRAGIGTDFTARQVRRLLPVMNCQCGRPAVHKGMCAFRMDRHPDGDGLRNRLSTIPWTQPGAKRRPHSEQRKKQIREKMLAYRASQRAEVAPAAIAI